jgi:hypothetical protein
MSARRLPVRPDLDQLKHQAKDLLKAYRDGDAEASADFAELHPDTPSAGRAKLADAQLVLARIYGASSWTRIVQCCQLIDAIWDDDLDTVHRLVTANRNLLIEDARIVSTNWGPPMSYAANLGRDRIIRLLYDLGARDLQQAMGRAVLQSQIETAAMLNEMLGKPAPPEGALGGAAYTLSVPGTEFVFRRGFQIRQGAGTPVETVIGSDSRRPADKRRILELYAEHGYIYPDTAMMAFHRGRFDLLEQHLARDPQLLSRQFAIGDIFPPEKIDGRHRFNEQVRALRHRHRKRDPARHKGGFRTQERVEPLAAAHGNGSRGCSRLAADARAASSDRTRELHAEDQHRPGDRVRWPRAVCRFPGRARASDISGHHPNVGVRGRGLQL